MSNKEIKVIILTMDLELDFAIHSSTTGKELLHKVYEAIGLRETWYFGLQFTDSKGALAWLKPDKKVLKQVAKKDPHIQFSFRAKFYPESIEDEIIQEVTMRLFFLQVKVLVLSGEIYCSAENAVLLASYAMQFKYGDYNPHQHEAGHLASDRLMCERIFGQFKLSKADWEKRVMLWWSDHKGTSRESAMLEYLKVAQDLEMYGINYFEIRNKKGSELYLGVDALGLNVYSKDNKLNPKVGFPWSEVRNLSFYSKKFVIKPVEKNSDDFVLYAADIQVNKRILALCMGNHELYMRRRKPLSAEMQQLKQRAVEERVHRQLEQDRVTEERSAREAAEQKQRDYEAQLHRMKEDMDRTQHELAMAQEVIQHLEQQIIELNEYKRELETKEQELEYLTQQLYSERQMSEEERVRLAEKIAAHEGQVAEMRLQVQMKTDHTNKLHREVHGNSTMPAAVVDDSYFVEENDRSDVGSNAHIEMQRNAKDGVVKVSFLNREHSQLSVTNKSKDIRQKLHILTNELDAVKDEQKMTAVDLQHMENKTAGRDKYKTLRQIRSGNTKRRIDQFENM